MTVLVMLPLYGEYMESVLIALLLKPLLLLVLAVFFLIPARLAVQRWLPDGKLKRFLLRES